MKRMWLEIKTVGLRDWLWFAFYLKRDEFSSKLDLNARTYNNREQLTVQRQRAHRIDMALESLR